MSAPGAPAEKLATVVSVRLADGVEKLSGAPPGGSVAELPASSSEVTR